MQKSASEAEADSAGGVSLMSGTVQYNAHHSVQFDTGNADPVASGAAISLSMFELLASRFSREWVNIG